MTNNIIIALIIFILFSLWEHPAIAQQKSLQPYYFEVHAAFLESFGPSETQAEITGDYDDLYYDRKKHFNPGFKTAYGPEIVAGYQKKEFQLQGSLVYFKQDIGLIDAGNFHNQYQFVYANMLSFKASAMLHFSNPKKRGPYGWYGGISAGTVFPISHVMNDQTKLYFGFNDFQPAGQFFWSIDESYTIRIGKKGLYTLAGFSITMPGLIGCIGKIQMEPNSPYTIIRDKVKMYSISGFLGFGFRLRK